MNEVSSDDLAANRAGRLAESQHAILGRRIRSLRWMYFSIAGTALVIAAVLNIGLYSETGFDEMFPFILAVDAIILLLMLPISWRMRVEIRKVRDDLADGRVQAQTGAIMWGYKGNTLIVGGQWFPPPKSLRGIDWKAAYTVYYTPRSRVIVAIEKG